MKNLNLLNALNKTSLFITTAVGYSIIDKITNLKAANEQSALEAQRHDEVIASSNALNDTIESLKSETEQLKETLAELLQNKEVLFDNKGDLLDKTVKIADSEIDKLVDTGSRLINDLSEGLSHNVKLYGNRPNSSAARFYKDSMVDNFSKESVVDNVSKVSDLDIVSDGSMVDGSVEGVVELTKITSQIFTELEKLGPVNWSAQKESYEAAQKALSEYIEVYQNGASKLFDFDFSIFYGYLDSLTLFQEASLFNICLFVSLIFTIVNILGVLFGNEIIRKLNLEERFPRLSIFFSLRAKFQRYYLIWNVLILFALCISGIVINLMLFTV